MEDIDLTEAVTAVAKGAYDESQARKAQYIRMCGGNPPPGPAFEDLSPHMQGVWCELVAPHVRAAYASIARQAWDQGYLARMRRAAMEELDPEALNHLDGRKTNPYAMEERP